MNGAAVLVLAFFVCFLGFTLGYVLGSLYGDSEPDDWEELEELRTRVEWLRRIQENGHRP
jgi:membrane protein DedA with SNARE-associated domain